MFGTQIQHGPSLPSALTAGTCARFPLVPFPQLMGSCAKKTVSRHYFFIQHILLHGVLIKNMVC